MEIIILLSLSLQYFYQTSALTKSFVYDLFSSDEINGNVINSFNGSSIQICIALCDNTYGCLSVNFYEVTKQCMLIDYYPLDNTKSGNPSSGWKIYFRRNFGINVLDGAVAWQSSTFTTRQTIPLSAKNALDGRIDDVIYCAHTTNPYSYWAVEFGAPGPVKSVKIISRSDCCFSQQTNYTITVANTRSDVINDKGTVCGSYNGPEISTAPYSITITCPNTMVGRFLKIKHDMALPMVLCEVYVHTP